VPSGLHCVHEQLSAERTSLRPASRRADFTGVRECSVGVNTGQNEQLRGGVNKNLPARHPHRCMALWSCVYCMCMADVISYAIVLINV
jgi:hypothetical protein